MLEIASRFTISHKHCTAATERKSTESVKRLLLCTFEQLQDLGQSKLWSSMELYSLMQLVVLPQSRSSMKLYPLCIFILIAVRSVKSNAWLVFGTMAADNIPYTEMSALYDLYNATNGPHWAWYYNTNVFGIPWNFSVAANPCTDRWQGLNCTLNSTDYHITHIHLTAYNMKGTIPETIGQLTLLHTISLDFNGLYGSLPQSIGNLTKLRILNVNSNHIGGTIPESVYNLCNLSSLDIGINSIRGPISPSIGNLSALYSLSMHLNQLTGQIPSSLGQLTNLRYVNIGSNLLSGPIPASLGDLTQVTQLLQYVNALTGTVPVELTLLPVVHDLDLGANLLHGTIPAAFGNLTSLRQLFFDSNKLEGTIPASMSDLIHLRYFYLRDNAFTGTIPNTFGSMREMIELIYYQNQLTGTIPATFKNMVKLQYFDVGENHLTGPVPDAFANKTYLQYLLLDANMLTGTLPQDIGHLPTLIELVLNNNHMHGSIPTALSGLSTLELLLVQYNKFTGATDGVFNASSQTELSTVKINNNQLTGALDTQMLLLPRLRILVAGTNCFEGSLPPELCTASRLETLSLDGLSSASTCREPILPGISSSYLIPDSFSAALPQCLFHLPRLVTLHLSGIGLSGGLPGAISLGLALVDLGLSHNRLAGPIPHNFQQKLWYALDLSYNRFSGSLKSDFSSGRFEATDDTIIAANLSQYSTDVSLSLENNRLSGRIPSRVQQLQNISILGSNLFSCNLQASDLPEHDEGRSDYLCRLHLIRHPVLFLDRLARSIYWSGFRRLPLESPLDSLPGCRPAVRRSADVVHRSVVAHQQPAVSAQRSPARRGNRVARLRSHVRDCAVVYTLHLGGAAADLCRLERV